MSECKAVKTPMEAGCVIFEETDTEETDENLPVRELVGSLMYLMRATRPDLSYSVNTCSRHQSKPTKQLWTKLKRILRYLKSTIHLELFYPKNEKVMLVTLVICMIGSQQLDTVLKFLELLCVGVLKSKPL